MSNAHKHLLAQVYEVKDRHASIGLFSFVGQTEEWYRKRDTAKPMHILGGMDSTVLGMNKFCADEIAASTRAASGDELYALAEKCIGKDPMWAKFKAWQATKEARAVLKTCAAPKPQLA